MTRPRLADLCCCAGGAARGYDAASFDVTGWDIEWQKNYPYAFTMDDVLGLDPRRIGQSYDAFHASPSCKGYTALRSAHNARTHAREIPAFVRWLQATGRPWVLENVEDAEEEMREIVLKFQGRVYGPVCLCGSMFGLGAQGCRLERHRLFIANFPIYAPGHCDHDTDVPVIGVYGGHARIRAKRFGGRGTKDTWEGGHKTAMAQALGLPVGAMTVEEMSEAIPPAYTKFIGDQLMWEVKRCA